MSRVRVKVCGITRAEDAALAVELGADALGFVLWPRSPRAVTWTQAAELRRRVPALVPCVGVFVNEAPDAVSRAVREIGLQAIQLHGDEVVEDFRAAGVPIVKALALETDDDAARARDLPRDVTVLIDARDADRRGGTGRVANWTRASAVGRDRPIILAGGLTSENVREAIETVRPWAIDVSSGVEASPGIKSADRLRTFFAALAVPSGAVTKDLGPRTRNNS